jgi:hypothetical protein
LFFSNTHLQGQPDLVLKIIRIEFRIDAFKSAELDAGDGERLALSHFAPLNSTYSFYIVTPIYTRPGTAKPYTDHHQFKRHMAKDRPSWLCYMSRLQTKQTSAPGVDHHHLAILASPEGKSPWLVRKFLWAKPGVLKL